MQAKSSMRLVDVESITVPAKRRRGSRPIEALVESMGSVGLINPITLTEDLVLVGGWHRLKAAKALDWPEIAATITDADARLVEIDENLIRNELTALEFADHLAERKDIYEALHPATKHGHNTKESGQLGHSLDLYLDDPPPEPTVARFSADAAKKTGLAERSVRRAVAIATKLDDEAKEVIRDLPIADNQRELQRLAKLNPAQQLQVAKKLAEGTRTVRGAVIESTREEAEEVDAPAGVDLRCCTIEQMFNDGVGEVGMVHADPPWVYDNQRLHGTVDGHYSDSPMGGIVEALNDAYEAAPETCYLLCWVTMPQLEGWFNAQGELRWRFLSAGAWVKTDGRPGIGFHWRGRSELLLLYAKGKPQPWEQVTPNAHVSTVKQHSEKPVAWLETLVRTFAPPGTTVLDLYAGRAPLARACAATGHGYVGCEVDPVRHREAVEALQTGAAP